MKKILFFLILIPTILLSQGRERMSSPYKVLQDYKYVIVSEVEGSFINDGRRRLVKSLKKNTDKIIVNLSEPEKTHNALPLELRNNPELGVYLKLKTESVRLLGKCFRPEIIIQDYEKNFLTHSVGPTCGSFGSVVGKTLNQLTSYDYMAPESSKGNTFKRFFGNFFDIASEKSIRDYLDIRNRELGSYEGIYRYANSNSNSQYKFLILKNDYIYYGFIMEANCNGCQYWTSGDTKFEMIEGAVPNLFDVTWKYPSRLEMRDDILIFTGEFEGGVIKSSVINGNSISLLKLYPKLNSTNSTKINEVNEWKGNGSGLILSKSGHIITNNHVIENSNKIEVEFIQDGEVKKYNAEIIQTDKVNDLAILKINDSDFIELKSVDYNFKTRTADVGTSIYTYGYPLALSVMGKEVKVTNGIISAKSGFNGDITTYQISAPIQKGNSGGPLFDNYGNFLGINSSVINKDIAENVGYSIKSNYVLNLIDVLPSKIILPSDSSIESKPLTEQVKQISQYVVLIKVN
jgi:S1-C subfamily serine protease